MLVDPIVTYFSIFAKLGKKKHTILAALLVNITLCILSELFAYFVIKNPMFVGNYIIVCNVILIIYFAFRDGFKGGYSTITVTLVYYFFIMYTRHYQGEQLILGIVTTIMLGTLYFFIASVIGFSKHLINILIEREANGKRQLETVIQQLPVGIVITDHLGKIIHSNMKVDEIMGRNVLLGSTVGTEYPFATNRISEKNKRYTRAPLATVLASKNAVVGREYIFLHPLKKKKIYLQVSATPIFNAANKFIAAASIMTDITDQKELEERKSNFMNITSHELRTPLTSAKIFLQLAKRQLERNTYETLPTTLDKLGSQLDRLQFLVQEMLDSTRMQKGKIQFNREFIYIRPLVEEVINDLQITTTHKIELRWTTHVLTYSDKEHIRQVISNLITNAIKFSPKRSKIIVSSLLQGDQLVIGVQDFGIGISPDDQERIFEHFYQAYGNKSNLGLGLGLYIASEIVKQHGGKMWVKSTVGKGSTFYFSLQVSRKENIRKKMQVTKSMKRVR